MSTPTLPWIQGYASSTSVKNGEQLAIHVGVVSAYMTYAGKWGWSYTVLRVTGTGAGDTLMVPNTAGTNSTSITALPTTEQDQTGYGWPESFKLGIPASWPVGIYRMVFKIWDDKGADYTSPEELTFVVRSPSSGTMSRILLHVAVATQQAYNTFADENALLVRNCLYPMFSSSGRALPRVSFDRPGSLLGWARWEQRFIQWLNENGIAVEYCTSVDLHLESNLLSRYQLLVSVGHDEYWSKEMREHVEAFIASGGNVAFFSGNNCVYKVRFEDACRTMVCYKDSTFGVDPLATQTPDQATGFWNLFRGQNAFIGVGHLRGGIVNAANVPYDLSYDVHFPGHWAFDGVPLGADGKTLSPSGEGVIGYETDAAEFTLDSTGLPKVTGADGSPPNFIILASRDLANTAFGTLGGTGNPGITLGIYRSGGLVFTASTTNWAMGLVAANSGRAIGGPIAKLTANVLKRLSQPATAVPVANTWYREGAGVLTQNSAGALSLLAASGGLWISQALPVLDRGATYRVSAWMYADAPGARIAVQGTTTWVEFAVAAHSGSSTWELLSAQGILDDGAARVKLQVPAGCAALCTGVSVWANGAPLAISNSHFDQWNNHAPSGWNQEGAGTLTMCALSIDARSGQTWVSHDLPGLESGLTYQARGWVRADRPGARLVLQSTKTWVEFASAEHTGSGTWEYLTAEGNPSDEGPLFPGRVKLQVDAGIVAVYTAITVSIKYA